MNIKYLGTTTGFLGAIDAKDVVGVGFSIRVLTAVSAMGWYLFGDVFRGDPGTEGEQLRRSTVWRVLVGSGDAWPMFNRGNRDVPLHMSVDNQMSISGLESLHIFAAYGEVIDGDKLNRFVNRRGATMKMSAFRVMPFERAVVSLPAPKPVLLNCVMWLMRSRYTYSDPRLIQCGVISFRATRER